MSSRCVGTATKWNVKRK